MIQILIVMLSIFSYIACEQQVCYDELGCFSNGGAFFSSNLRPINLLPQSPRAINTKFVLYSNKNIENSIELSSTNEGSIRNSTFNAKLSTKMIIHGFLDSMNWITNWVQAMTTALLEREPLNVIVVDWSEGATEYPQAVANARVVGAQVAQLIRSLEKTTSISLSSIQLIGHSLGSHVAGYAGKRLNGTLGRITGLSPSGLYFDGLPKEVKLDKSDAQFVDTINTDSRKLSEFEFGTNEPIGHLAFYPNGGHQQPHCSNQRKLEEFKYDTAIHGIWNFVFCDHQQSIDFYIEAIRNKLCTPIAYTCSDYSTYLSGQCNQCLDGQRCAVLGPRAEELKSEVEEQNETVKVYLKMGSQEYHYCLRQYHVQVRLVSHPQNLFTSQFGNLTLIAHADNGDAQLDLSGAHQFKYNATNHFLATTDKNDLSSLTGLHVLWDNINMASLDQSRDYQLFVENISIEPIWITDKEARNNQTRKFCPRYPNEGIVMRSVSEFEIC